MLPLFLALYIGQSFHYLTPFLKKILFKYVRRKNMNTAQPIRSEQELKDFMNFMNRHNIIREINCCLRWG